MPSGTAGGQGPEAHVPTTCKSAGIVAGLLLAFEALNVTVAR